MGVKVQNPSFFLRVGTLARAICVISTCERAEKHCPLFIQILCRENYLKYLYKVSSRFNKAVFSIPANELLLSELWTNKTVNGRRLTARMSFEKEEG